MSQDNVIPMKVGFEPNVKPCPFCGAEADESDVDWTSDESICFVVCGGCFAEGPVVTDGCDGPIDEDDMVMAAIDLWNQRA